MHRCILYWFFMVSVSSLHPVDRSVHLNNVVRLIDDRRRSNSPWDANSPSHQPKVGGLHPGHTLLRPKPRTLKSAVKYPKHSLNHLVYGNPDNLNYFYKKKNIKRGHKKTSKHQRTQHKNLLGTHKGKSYIPRVGGLHPGHALLKPKGRMLESAATFPKDDAHLVYGNRANYPITYNKTSERVLYTGFRRMNDDTVDNVLLDAIRNLRYYKQRNNKQAQSDSVLVIAIEPGSNEIMDETTSSSEEVGHHGEVIVSRRQKKQRDKHANLKRKDQYGAEPESASKSSDSSDTSDSQTYEKNPGNEYTLHKNRYKQNWLWNHAMTGDHMNINPYGPLINAVGPNGVDLFFGRKWWYFNQDDYKPMR